MITPECLDLDIAVYRYFKISVYKFNTMSLSVFSIKDKVRVLKSELGCPRVTNSLRSLLYTKLFVTIKNLRTGIRPSAL